MVLEDHLFGVGGVHNPGSALAQDLAPFAATLLLPHAVAH